jgi:hypothetical protein
MNIQLEGIRAMFPRLYLYNDTELFSLIGCPRDSVRISQHAQRLFSSIDTVVINKEFMIPKVSSGLKQKEDLKLLDKMYVSNNLMIKVL